MQQGTRYCVCASFVKKCLNWFQDHTWTHFWQQYIADAKSQTCVHAKFNSTVFFLTLGYFCHCGPWGEVKRIHFYIIAHGSINLVCMCRSTNYLWICTVMYYLQLSWFPWQPWQPCIWLILWTNCKTSEEKGYSISCFYNSDHR